MPTLRTLGGKLIVRGGDLGTDDKCCCGCCCVDGEPDPTKTDEAACTDAGGFWFAAEADCENVDCTGCACVFPIDDALMVTFEVTVEWAVSTGLVSETVTIVLAPDNAEGYYTGSATIGQNVEITCLFGCGGDIADTFGIPASKYWSTVTAYYPGDGGPGSAVLLEAEDIGDFGLHDTETYTLSGGSRICKPQDNGGSLASSAATASVGWAVTIEEPFIT